VNKIRIVIICSFIFACGSNPPPAPPPIPPPVEVCGNGSCLPPETVLTCPADCKAPDPEPVRPKVRVHTGDRMITLGIYGAFNSATSDFMRIAEKLYDSKYTGAVIFLMIPGTQVPGKEYWPWIYDSQKKIFLLDKQNPVYYKRFAELLAAFEWYGLDLILCFDDVYFEPQWVKNHQSKIHPYRQNNFGIHYFDKKLIYDSATFSPLTYYWLRWTNVAELKLQFVFTANNQLGTARLEWIRTIMDMTAAKKKQSPNKEWRIGWKRANEELGIIDPVTGKTSAVKSYGDRSEIYALFCDEWRKRGLKHDGKTFYTFVNRWIRGGTFAQFSAASKILHDSITRPYGQHGGMGAIHEVHIDGAVDPDPNDSNWMYRDVLIKIGLQPAKTFWSTDGMPKLSPAQYQKDNRDLLKLNDLFVDVLYEEDVWGLPVKTYPQYQYNFDQVFEKHKEIVQ
jgi:hypothetical protein